MSDGDDADQGSEALGGKPTAESVDARADGRTPEESTSDDPQVQAEVILEESEERIAQGAKKSEGT